MSRDHLKDAQDIATRALTAAMENFNGEQYAVVVIVRKLPHAGLPIVVNSNITSGASDVRAIIDQGRNAVPGGIIV